MPAGEWHAAPRKFPGKGGLTIDKDRERRGGFRDGRKRLLRR